MSESLVHIVTIEGVANTDGQLKLCYPKVPDSHTGDGEYIVGLAERPTGVTGQWDFINNSVSVGRFSLRLLEGKTPFSWMAVRPPVRAQTAEAVDDDQMTIDVDRSASDSGWTSLPTTVYCDRETWRITATSGTPDIDVIRGIGGSTKATHAIGADVFDRPPVLIGRKVTVYETPAAGGAETIVLRGHISGEPAMGLVFPQISVVNTWTDKRIRKQGTVRPYVSENRPVQIAVGETDEGAVFRPSGITQTGSLWLFADGGVLSAEYADGIYQFGTVVNTVYGDMPDFKSFHSRDARKVLLSDNSPSMKTYPPFGRDTLSGDPVVPDEDPETSDNPFIIVLNLLLTSATSDNYDDDDTYTYDLGDYNMWPDFALGIDRSQIDMDTFNNAINLYEGIHCDRLWLGGQTEGIWACIERILSPLGYSCGSDRTGTITLVRLSDVYPGDTTVTLSRTRNILPGSIQHQTMSRAVNEIAVELDPGPEGQAESEYIVTDTGARELYPSQVGEDLKREAAPYSYAQFTGDANRMVTMFATRIRRLATTIPVASCKLGPTGFNDVDFGTPVTIYDRGLRDPSTGDRLQDGEQVKGITTKVSPDFDARTQQVSVALVSTGRVCLIGPSAAVTGWTGDPKYKFDIETTEYSDDDSSHFAVGDQIVLLDEHLVAHSGTVMTITNVGSSYIIVDANPDGYTAGDILVPAEWDDLVTSQQTSGYAWDADGGAPTTDYPSLGADSDETFIYGD